MTLVSFKTGLLVFFSQDTLEYKKKQRPLKIRMLDGTVKTVMVDDSKIVSDMLMTICARIGEPSGILNGQDFSN